MTSSSAPADVAVARDPAKPPFDINPDPSPSERQHMISILTDLMYAFALHPSLVPAPAPGITHRINLLDPTLPPIKQAAYRESPEKQAAIAAKVAELLAAGLIRRSYSPWSSPVIMVPKADGSRRMCMDFRKLNARTRKDAYPIPNMTDCLNTCRTATDLSLIDIKDAFHHVEMDADSIPLTAFVTSGGLYEWLRMSFGLCNAPATFQRYVDYSLRDVLGKCCVAFFDDCLVYTNGGVVDHATAVASVLRALAAAGLEASLKKCHFAYAEVLFIGHLVSHGMIKPDLAKLRAISQYPASTNVIWLRSFIGLASYYHKFLRGFATICAPLYRLTRKAVEFVWSQPCIIAFEAIKTALLDDSSLQLPISPFHSSCRLMLQASASALCSHSSMAASSDLSHSSAVSSMTLSLDTVQLSGNVSLSFGPSVNSRSITSTHHSLSLLTTLRFSGCPRRSSGTHASCVGL